MRRWIALLALCLGALLALPALAAADTGDVLEPQHEPPTSKDGFQAGTCYENQVEEDPEKTDLAKPFCSAETPGLFFTQAGGHPPFAFDQYIVQHEVVAPNAVEPLIEPYEDRVLKTERVDLPVGFAENPQSSPKCSQEDFEAIGEIPGSGGKIGRVPTCDPSTIVGRDETWLVVNTENAVPAPPPAPPGTFLPRGFVLPPDATRGTRVPVYNLEPNPGEPARLGFIIGFARVIVLEGGVAWESDFHEYFTLHLPEPSVPFSSLRSRLVAFGQSGDGTHVTLPTTCFDPEESPKLYSTWFRGESWGEPNPTFPEGSTPWQATLPPGVRTTGCDSVPFEPSIETDLGTDIDSPVAATLTANVPFEPAKEGGEVRNGDTEGISQSHVRKAEVTLPLGMGLNPSGSVGLEACTDAQFKKGVRVYENECPAASKVGTVEVESPPLAEALHGDVYVGEQKSMDPSSGEQFRILVEAKSEHEGIALRLVGHVSADPGTGQLTAVFDEQQVGPFAGALPQGLPQAPLESVKIAFDKSKAVLTSPPTCSPADTNGEIEPWARPGTTVPVTYSFTKLTTDPGGGSCPQTLAARKFAPGYSAYSDSTAAGKYSPFWVNVERPDGQQEVKLIDVTLPEGLTAKLTGIPYCSEGAIAAAAGKAGKAEQASPSCSDASKIGTTTTDAGTGGSPLKLPGNAYLAGPYKGAPLSLAVITPAVSGPYDLGTVVVRVALNVNPITAQVNAVSDAIPDVYGGVKLDIRKIYFNADRPQFMVNPTNCQRKETKGTINGGGGNPANPAAWSSYKVSYPYQPLDCGKLKFKPKLHIRLKGKTRRAGYPQLRAVLETRKNDANVARTALNLPPTFLVEQAHMKKVCTRPQFASQTCPSNTIYGYAEAKSPLLDRKLKGWVYLVPSNHTLPDLVADLRGQVNIQLYGVISTKHGGIKTVFNGTPDVPVSKFILNMRGGSRGLIVNSTNICKAKRRAILNIKGHNSRRVKTNHFRLNLASCPKNKKRK